MDARGYGVGELRCPRCCSRQLEADPMGALVNTRDVHKPQHWALWRCRECETCFCVPPDEGGDARVTADLKPPPLARRGKAMRDLEHDDTI